MPYLPPAASSHAAAIDGVMTLVHLLMLVLFVGWGTLQLRVRAHPIPPEAQPTRESGWRAREYALATEIGLGVAEVILLVIFALPLWFDPTAAQPSRERGGGPRLAEQFAWNVHYPGADGRWRDETHTGSPTNPLGLDRQSPFGKDDIVLLSLMHLPVNRPVIIQLSSKDVIHSFGVPAMRVKQDAIPAWSRRSGSRRR